MGGGGGPKCPKSPSVEKLSDRSNENNKARAHKRSVIRFNLPCSKNVSAQVAK